MRIECVLLFRDPFRDLFRDTEPRHVLIDCRCQRSQSWACLNPDPEHSRRPRPRKESIPAKAHFEAEGLNRFQRPLDGLNLFLGLLSEELQRDVQRCGSYPVRIRGKSMHLVEEAGNSAAYVVVDIKRDEKAHKISF